MKAGIKVAEVEEFLKKKFEKAGYSHANIEQTPLGTRIIVFVHKPGLVIGRSGRTVNELTEEIKEKFGFENPLVDVREVENPILDANIVAKRIARSLERGINYKKVCNYYLEQVMQAGATGIKITVAGKLGGSERSRSQKFSAGYVAHSGEYAEKYVEKGYAQAMLKPGVVGIKVLIMKEAPEGFVLEKKIRREEEKPEEELGGDSETEGDKGDET